MSGPTQSDPNYLSILTENSRHGCPVCGKAVRPHTNGSNAGKFSRVICFPGIGDTPVHVGCYDQQARERATPNHGDYVAPEHSPGAQFAREMLAELDRAALR